MARGGARAGAGRPSTRHKPSAMVPIPALPREDESPTEIITGVHRFTAWVIGEVTAGRMTASTAKALEGQAGTLVKGARLKSGLDEMSRLEDMLRRAEAAANQRKKNEIADRYQQGSEGYAGITATPVEPDPPATTPGRAGGTHALSAPRSD